MAFSASKVLMDPTVANPCIPTNLSIVRAVQISPLFTAATLPTLNGINVGPTQYVDGYARANAWSNVAGTAHHTLLTYNELPAATVTVSASAGNTAWVNGNACGQVGQVEINAWDALVQGTLLPYAASRGAGPDSLVVFLLPSVVMFEGSTGECCILGYHSAITSAGGVQTYLTADFDVSSTFDLDIGVLSHEIAEWLANPLTTNTAPSWGHIGQVSNCSPFLEVADPLSGTLVQVAASSYYYFPQELAFTSWFFRQPAGALGTYSSNGSFNSNAGAICR
jgi:hypothetical protein